MFDAFSPSRLSRRLTRVAAVACLLAAAIAGRFVTAADGDLYTGRSLIAPDGAVLPLYRVSATGAATAAIAFTQRDGLVMALDDRGDTLWSLARVAQELFGGFDFDADGWPDLGLALYEDTGARCGSEPLRRSQLLLLSGRNGVVHAPLSPLDDTCFSRAGATYPVIQWSIYSMIGSGGPGGTFSFQPTYATTGWFMRFTGTAFATEAAYYFPSTGAYDAAYPASRPNPWGLPYDFVDDSHYALGLLLPVGGEERLVFFTSGRVAQYRLGPLEPAQLVRDHPFLNGGRTDIAGRSYGVLARDPRAPESVVVLAGSLIRYVFLDALAGREGSDPWAGLERHVTRYDAGADRLDHRFFSYARDAGDTHQYRGRVAYATRPFLDAGPGSPSRIAWNVYDSGRWQLHISRPGETADALVLDDVLLWDVRDINGDGREELITSPTTRELASGPAAGRYLPAWRTDIFHWNEALKALTPVRSYSEGIPYMVLTFNEATRTSAEHLSAVTSVTGASGPQLLLVGPDGSLRPVDLPPRFGPAGARIAWRHAATGGNVIWEMAGAEIARTIVPPALADPEWDIAATPDLDGDGSSDLLWRHRRLGVNAVWHLDGEGLARVELLPVVTDPGWRIAATTDLDGDGHQDLLWRHQSGLDAAWFMSGAALERAVLLPAVAEPAWQIAAAGDLDGDGLGDIVWRNGVTGADRVWLMDGSERRAEAALPGVTDRDWHIVGLDDFDADGGLDLLWRHARTGANVVWLLDGTEVAGHLILPAVEDPNWHVVGPR